MTVWVGAMPHSSTTTTDTATVTAVVAPAPSVRVRAIGVVAGGDGVGDRHGDRA